jgi:PiT family inorganic phosphate transporter
MPEILIVLVVVGALAFDYINGFHDTANAIATVVSTRVLTPTMAIGMAAVLNFAGALCFTKVAETISKSIVDQSNTTQTVVLGAIVAAIVWNLVTWLFGIPSSSSHALIGGLVGAALAKGGSDIVKWHGLVDKVFIPLFASPLLAFAVGYLVMSGIARSLGHMNPGRVGGSFRKLQVASSALMAFSHGLNDAQKSMGMITLALMSGGFIHTHAVPMWVKLACAVAMALGTAVGGWRIIRTLGHKIIRLDPVHGFAAETSGATVILTASFFGMPISTTHAITASIFGVGASKRLSAVRWQVARSVLVAWVITIPATAALGALSYLAFSQIWH